MQNLTVRRIARMSVCRADLLDNGIDLTTVRVRGFVRQHLEYFQLMLGDESTAAQVVELIGPDVQVGDDSEAHRA